MIRTLRHRFEAAGWLVEYAHPHWFLIMGCDGIGPNGSEPLTVRLPREPWAACDIASMGSRNYAWKAAKAVYQACTEVDDEA